MLRFSYREHAEQFAAACDWLIDLGVSVDSTRAAEYRAMLAAIAEYYEAGKIDALVEKHGYPRLFNATVEAHEFNHIHTGLIGRSDTEMLSRLREFVRGTALLIDESPQRNKNRSRNIGFELSVAAAAARSAVPITFEAPGDLCLLPKSDPIAVECKRPFTARKIEARVSEGIEQLRQRYKSSANPRDAHGILALSITKTENDGSKHLVGPDEASIRVQIDGIFLQFISQHRRHWESRVDGRTLAVLLELCAPCRIATPSILAVAREYAWLPLCELGSENRRRLERVALAFNKLITPVTPAG